MILVCIIAAFAIAVPIVFAVLQNSNKRQVIATVTEKTVKNEGNSGKYLIFTKDKDVEVYTIRDDIFQGRWDSSDLYGSIEEGKKYTFTVVGVRNHFFSLYPNILEAREVLK